MKKIFKKGIKKILPLLMVLGILLSSIGFPPFMTVKAGTPNMTKLEIQTNSQGTNTISIDTTDTNKIIYKIGETIVGSAKVKVGSSYVTPETVSYFDPQSNENVTSNKKVAFLLTEYSGDNYDVVVEVTSQTGYQHDQNYFYQGQSDSFPGDNIINLTISANNVHTLDFAFSAEGGNNPNPGNNPQGPENPGGSQDSPADFVMYPLISEFEGIESPINVDNGKLLLPDNWTNGKINFKAKACKMDIDVDGSLQEITIPNNGEQTCKANSEYFEPIRIEGIVGLANDTVTGSQANSFINVNEKFTDYKNETIHITSSYEKGPINQSVSLQTKDVIILSADAPISMSYGLGSLGAKQTSLSTAKNNNISVFFGNNTVTLTASGLTTNKISSVDNNGNNVTLNDNGSATLTLPEISVETTSTVKVTILLKDGKTEEYTVNIVRTAIILKYDNREKDLRAGYVMNKAHLYNNKTHDASGFDAYLQVILYNGDNVVGYKQVQIDDKDVVDNELQLNGSWSIETFDENPIVLLKDISNDITGAGVFLTNGPISFDDETLPSIEYGIGSGVKISWEAE